MQNDIKIRQLLENDYISIAELSGQLGGKIDTDEVRKQIAEITSKADHFAFVAEMNNKVVGYIHCFVAVRLTTKPFIEIGGLVVDNSERRKGIGKLLVQEVEKICDDNQKARVRCNSKRQSAHDFYYSLDYSLSKEQKIFEK